MIELYWMALLRNMHAPQWDDHPLVAAAANELSTLPLFVNRQKPNEDPATARFESLRLSAKSVFRGGELARVGNVDAGVSRGVGPFVSQFLLHEIPYGTLRIPQRCIHAAPEFDYMAKWSEWLLVQNGERRNPNQNSIGEHDPSQRRYLATMRDLATYVHYDALYEAYLNAALILLGSGSSYESWKSLRTWLFRDGNRSRPESSPTATLSGSRRSWHPQVPGSGWLWHVWRPSNSFARHRSCDASLKSRVEAKMDAPATSS